MERLITEDGSVTFYSDSYEETYHSKRGAIEESFKKFVEPCNIAEIAKKGDIKILDVCFGIGYNTLAALYTILKINPDCKVEVIGLEKDKKILKKINYIEVPFYLKGYYNILKVLVNNKIINNELNFNFNKKINNKYNNFNDKNININKIKNGNMKNINIKIIIGDATKTIKKINKSFDAVFHDPFSPPKNPELWTLELFKEIKERMNLTARLATYSCATNVRKNMNKAGFKVIDGPCVGRKSPATTAINMG